MEKQLREARLGQPPVCAPPPDSPVLESEWTLAAVAARDSLRRRQEEVAAQPVQESEWTLAAYRGRTERVTTSRAASPAEAPASGAPAAPEIRIDFRPHRFEQASTTPPDQGPRLPARRLAYVAGAAGVLALGALLWRATPAAPPPGASAPRKVDTPHKGAAPAHAPDQVPTPSPTPSPPPAEAVSSPPPAPAPAASPAASPAAPVEPPKAPPKDIPAASGASAGQASPPAVEPPPRAPASRATDAPAIPKTETGPQPESAATPGSTRPAESKPSAARKKPRAGDARPNPARERREPRAAGWFDQMVNSVKRLGRALTP